MDKMGITIIAIFSLIVACEFIQSAHIGLFASTGCYSHDIMMRHFARRLISKDGGSHNVTLIQIRVYEFDRPIDQSKRSIDGGWNELIYHGCNNESMAVMRHFQRRMWTSMVPYDTNLLDFEGVGILMNLHEHHRRACSVALRDPVFMNGVQKLRLDLLVTDYVLNECALRFSELLDVNLAYLSNYPVLSSYAADLGITSNPSYVPSVIGYETTPMTFPRRVLNSMLYFLLWSTRQSFDLDARLTFSRALGHRFMKSKSKKAKNRRVLSFSTPFEMLMDTARPVARNLHYFGCDHCFESQHGWTEMQNVSEKLNITIANGGIILVSFGTVSKSDQIPVYQLQRLVATFARFPRFTFIWHLDVGADYFNQRVLAPINAPWPSNVHLFSWIPLKQLLADRNVVLLINHGGVSTCFEALHHGVPILGVALQGDQGYNLRRFVEKGIAEMLPVSSLTENAMYENLSGMINNIERYKSAAAKLRAMIRDHKSLYARSPSTFWTGWAARQFGQSRNGSKAAVMAKRFLNLRYASNWCVHYCLDIVMIPASLISLWAVFIWRKSIK